MKDIERVHVAVGKAGTIWTEGRQVDSVCLGAVHTAKVDGELIVDKHPHVIVALEAEGACPVIRKGSMDLRAEVKVVLVNLVAEALVVDREIRVAVEVVLAADTLGAERDGLARDHSIDPRDRVEPLIEPVAVGSRAAGATDWLAIRAERGFNNSRHATDTGPRE